MGSLSWWHVLLVIVVALMLFGSKGKVSDLMGDVAKGIKSFKKGLADEPEEQSVAETARSIEQVPEPVAVKPAAKPKAAAKKAKS